MKNKETLLEVAERLKDKELFKESNGRAKEFLSKIKNKETLEEASINFAHNYFEMHESNNYQALKLGFKEGAKWQSEQNTWYNEEQTNKRMNVIGQNGNDGTHYENK